MAADPVLVCIFLWFLLSFVSLWLRLGICHLIWPLRVGFGLGVLVSMWAYPVCMPDLIPFTKFAWVLDLLNRVGCVWVFATFRVTHVLKLWRQRLDFHLVKPLLVFATEFAHQRSGRLGYDNDSRGGCCSPWCSCCRRRGCCGWKPWCTSCGCGSGSGSKGKEGAHLGFGSFEVLC